ncbi:MAG: hypothetical protein AAF138_07655 [Planctomycetota bacterium]
MIGRRSVVILLSALCLMAPAQAQPSRLDVGAVEEAIRAVYTTQRTAESAEFRVRSAEGERQGRAEVWIDPSASEVGVDLDGLRLWMSGVLLRVADAPTGGRYWEASLPDRPVLEALGSVLPPLALPQLGSAFGAGTAGRSGMAPGLVWEIAQQSARSIRLVGRSGPVTATAQVGDGRWRRMTLHDDDAGWALDARFSTLPAAKLERAGWVIDAEGRTRVDALSDLRPPPRVSELPEAPEFPVMTMAGPPASHSALRFSLRDAGLGVFVLYRAGDDEIGRRAVAAVRAAQEQPGVGRVWPVAVHRVAGFERSAVSEEVVRWDRRLRAQDRLFWAAGEDATLGAVSEDAAAPDAIVALAVDADGRRWITMPVTDDAALAEFRVRLDVAARALAAEQSATDDQP